MLLAEYYLYVYMFIVAIVSISSLRKYSHYTIDRLNLNFKEPILPSLILAVFMVIFIGLRPISGVFMDMAGTAGIWDYWNIGIYEFSWNVENKIYDNLRMFLATSGVPVETFFLIIAIIYFISTLAACRKLFPKDTLLAYVVFLAAFSTFSYGTNGIKAGAAASIFLLAIAYYDKPLITVSLSLISWGFHHSMVMVVASYFIVYFYHKPKWFFVLWIFSVIIATLHISTFQSLFASLADEHGKEYLEGVGAMKGFRLDFILYSAMPVLVGYYAITKKNIESIPYSIILCLYLMTNSIWMLCMYASFTNRIAYLSWFQYPIVLIYPFLNEKWGTGQYATLKKVAYGHLAFTLFMVLIFYA